MPEIVLRLSPNKGRENPGHPAVWKRSCSQPPEPFASPNHTKPSPPPPQPENQRPHSPKITSTRATAPAPSPVAQANHENHPHHQPPQPKHCSPPAHATHQNPPPPTHDPSPPPQNPSTENETAQTPATSHTVALHARPLNAPQSQARHYAPKSQPVRQHCHSQEHKSATRHAQQTPPHPHRAQPPQHQTTTNQAPPTCRHRRQEPPPASRVRANAKDAPQLQHQTHRTKPTPNTRPANVPPQN